MSIYQGEPLPQLKALADPTRLAIVDLVARSGSFNVSEIQAILDVGQSTVSRHLNILARAGLLSARREGREIFYRRRVQDDRPDFVSPLLAAMSDTTSPEQAARLAEIIQRRRALSRAFFDAPKTSKCTPALPAPAPSRTASVGYVSSTAPETAVEEIDIAGPGLPQELDGSTRPRVPDVYAWVLQRLAGCSSVVEVGTGDGRFLPSLQESATRVIAVDGSKALLAAAADFAAAHPGAPVDARVGELDRLPLVDGEVDAAVAHMVMHHAPDPPHAVTELARILCPGGRVVIGDLFPHDEQWMREELADQWLGLDEFDVRTWLEQAGFGDIEWTRIEEPGALKAFVVSARRR